MCQPLRHSGRTAEWALCAQAHRPAARVDPSHGRETRAKRHLPAAEEWEPGHRGQVPVTLPRTCTGTDHRRG